MDKPTNKQITDVLAGIATPEDAKEVARWFATEEGTGYVSKAFDRDAAAIRPDNAELYVPHPIPSEEIWANIGKQIHRRRFRRTITRVAAVLLPFILLAGLFYRVHTEVDIFGSDSYEEVYVPKGERLQMMFQDGTRVYLNSDTRLRYPKKFGLRKREMELSGEGYFKVAKDKRPFVVDLDGPSVHVKGTEFNIQNYPESKIITVCLDEGKINMRLVSEKEISVRQGQEVIYDKENDECLILTDKDMHYESMWKQNIIAFKDTPWVKVEEELGRWYNVTFEVKDKIPQDLLITLISKQTALENVLRDLQKITPLAFVYDSDKGHVEVYHRPHNDSK